jgi:RHS repeat-associated protein
MRLLTSCDENDVQHGQQPGVCNTTYDDPTVPFSIGRITAVANSNSSTNYLQYDAFGNILQSSQTTTGSGCPSNICAFTYTYNLTGALTSEQYPSGRMVTTTYDGANRPKQLTGLLNGTTTTYADTIQYLPHGAVQSYNFNKGQLSRNYSFNSARLQPTEISDTVVGQTSPLLDFKLFWGDNGTQATNNNGVLRQEIATTGKGGNLTSPFTASETYAYDSVKRIKSVIDTVGSAVPERDFQYDAAGNGNMWVSRNDGALPQYSYMPNGQTSINPANNQLTASSNAYDFAGNQTLLNNTLALTYDGENRLILAGPSGQAATFDYDASGARIRQTSSTHLKTVYIYDAMGQLAAETPAPGANSPCLTCYLSSDHLGTTRMVTAQDTSLIARHDYLPFGDELDYGTGNRSSSLWGAADGVHQRYTGQEDDGNGLMFFQNRYYSGIQGRFNSPDPANFGADILSPESWNGYAYVMNSPMTDVDPDGLQTSVSVSSGGGGGGDAGALGLLGLAFPFLNYAISFDSGPPKGMTNAQQMQFQNVWNSYVTPPEAKQVGTLEGFVPIVGNLRQSVYDIEAGHVPAFAWHLVLAGSDVFLVKSIAVSSIKIGAVGFGALAIKLAAETTAEEGDHIVLGLEAHGLQQTATRVGGRTLMNDVNWQTSLQKALGNPSTRLTISLDGVSGTSPYSQFMSAVQRGITHGATPFNWDMGQLFQAGRHVDATFIQGGRVLVNPFR